MKSINQIDFSEKKAFVRVDFNVPLNEDGQITDDTRIRAAIPTIEYLINHSAKVILAAHFGRPKGQVNEKMRLTPVAARLSELLGQNVALTNSCIGDEAVAQSNSLSNGDVLLLENVRFFGEEEKNDLEFAKKLASHADMYVNIGYMYRSHLCCRYVYVFNDSLLQISRARWSSLIGCATASATLAPTTRR